MLVAKELEEALNQKAKEKQGNVIQADDPISFLQLQADKSGELGENVFETSLSQALVGGRTGGGETSGNVNKLNKVTQLTGFLRSGVRRGVRARQPVRHSVGRVDRQPDQRHSAELHSRVGDSGRLETGREAPTGGAGPERFLQH
jgi:hypothetical protein